MIKNFIIVAQDNQGNDKLPNRRITANTRTQEDPFWVTLGVAWVKKNAKGETFLSCKLEDDRTYTTKEGVEVNVKAQVIITEEEYNYLKNCEARVKMLTSPTPEFPNGIDLAKHPLNSPAEQAEYDNELDSIGF